MYSHNFFYLNRVHARCDFQIYKPSKLRFIAMGGSLPPLPPSLTHLILDNFDRELTSLPPSLTHLTFGWCFNQRVDYLPLSLTHLTFGTDFNQPINNLPSTLTELKIGDSIRGTKYKQPSCTLPQTMKRVTVYLNVGDAEPTFTLSNINTQMIFLRKKAMYY